MASIEDDRVCRRVEHLVDRHGEFDDTEVWSQMPPGAADLGDEEGADLVRQLQQLGLRQGARRSRGSRSTQQRHALNSSGDSQFGCEPHVPECLFHKVYPHHPHQPGLLLVEHLGRLIHGARLHHPGQRRPQPRQPDLVATSCDATNSWPTAPAPPGAAAARRSRGTRRGSSPAGTPQPTSASPRTQAGAPSRANRAGHRRESHHLRT